MRYCVESGQGGGNVAISASLFKNRYLLINIGIAYVVHFLLMMHIFFSSRVPVVVVSLPERVRNSARTSLFLPQYQGENIG